MLCRLDVEFLRKMVSSASVAGCVHTCYLGGAAKSLVFVPLQPACPVCHVCEPVSPLYIFACEQAPEYPAPSSLAEARDRPRFVWALAGWSVLVCFCSLASTNSRYVVHVQEQHRRRRVRGRSRHSSGQVSAVKKEKEVYYTSGNFSVDYSSIYTYIQVYNMV
jgi:hypothetical protein